MDYDIETAETGIKNPYIDYPEGEKQRNPGADAAALGLREQAEVQAMLYAAKMFPRNRKEVFDRIMLECANPIVAEKAVYSFPRGKSEISGPSINLVRTVAQIWGNIDTGIVELERTNEGSEIMSYAWDLETNMRDKRSFLVEHKRFTREGTFKLEDERDKIETALNRGSRLQRSCLSSLIPAEVMNEAVRKCEKTLRAKADTSPEGIKKIVEAFKGLGVTQNQIERRLNVHISNIKPGHVADLSKIYISIKDGIHTPKDFFEMEESAAEADAPKSKVQMLKTKMNN